MTQLTEQPGPVPELPPATEPAPARASKDRRVLRAALRWTAAVVVFAAFGAGAAYGVTQQTRGDLPGLATESDGRWEYPALEKPPLPKGAPAAFAERNTREEHFADLRKLVLPAPKGASEDKRLAGKDGWLPTATYLKAYEKDARGDLAQFLDEGGLRHVAARGWTMPDGTHTRIYVLRFGTGAFAREYAAHVAGNAAALTGAPLTEEDFSWTGEVGTPVQFTKLNVYEETRPYGAEQVRQAYIQAGDLVALVVQSGKGATPSTPFRQTVALQNQLLG
ncbi:hypothetical protein ACIRF8_00245 [Streptomyces sp. NPDC102406]|uniref:hypothetical protein n=1 Tax=Streptomyces sp. NPDC102406 TaxID=3366171 RepID=UPI00381E88A2